VKSGCKGTKKSEIRKEESEKIFFFCAFFLRNSAEMSIFAVGNNRKTTNNPMINREIIRIKIVQLTYAYYQNG
jgi:hypothetical protein